MNIKLRHIVLYLILVSMVAMGVSFSRFSTTLTNSGAENTALPDIEFSTWVLDHTKPAEPGEMIYLTGMVPGDERNIEIVVKNWLGEGTEGETTISGYDQSCKLELQTTGNLPLQFTLVEKKDAEDDVEIILFSNGYLSYISEGWEFTGSEKQGKNLELTIAWPEEIKDEFYKNEIDFLQVGLRAVQSN
jgi:hypothetical protein